MRKLSILILSALSVFALAAEDSTNNHDHHHNMGDHHPMMQGHHHGMEGMHKGTDSSIAGKPGDPDKVSRTIEVTMNDQMRFIPDRISVKSGETVRFNVKNAGKIPHEMVIGTMDELKEHAEMMRQMPNMKHAEPNMITLAGGQSGTLVWQFGKPGTVDFACLIPGHMEAGMVGQIEVK
ncbi:MAG: cupredoxin domain-containing protein [Candidatus Nitrosoglobus sp.]|jgi:uncharacterized cupredoxin-like copper-binding protein